MRFLQPILRFLVAHKLGSITLIQTQRFAGVDDIDAFQSLVVLVAPLLEVLLHHVDKILVLTGIHSVVFHVDEAVLMQDFRHFLAVLLPAWLTLQIARHIDGWDFDPAERKS